MFVYVPPPAPARTGRSPWLWIGLGCGLLVLLTFGGCALSVFLIGKQVAREQKRPITRQGVLQSVRPIPVYPGAQVDLEQSKALRAGGSVVSLFSLGKVRTEMAAFVTPAPPEKVIAWYDSKMADWQRVKNTRRSAPMGASPQGGEMRQYQRGDKQALVQVRKVSGQGQERSLLVLMLISGIPGQRSR